MLAGVRRLLVLVCTIIFVDALLFGALTPLIPGFVDDFGLSKTQAGLLVGAFGGGALVGGIPGGLLAGRFGPKRAVVLGLLVLSAASVGFALASGPTALGIARFVQGCSSTTTWAGALAWITVEAPRGRRGQLLGSVFGLAVLGAILGPMFGAVAKLAGIRPTFATIGAVAFLLALAASAHRPARAQQSQPRALHRALGDAGFLTGLWLNTLPAFFFGALSLLAPLALSDHGFGTFAIAAVFLSSGLIETGANPLVGRLSDSRGRLLPIRVALAGSTVVAALLAATEHPWLLAPLVAVAGICFGGFYTPGMALVSDRAEAAGVAQGLAFGVMNTAWALGQMSGPSLGGALAEGLGDPAPYVLSSALCALTLLVITTRARTLRAA
jgi:MFS family permease